MAKGSNAGRKQRGSNSPKTAKRLAAKKAMLAAKTRRKGRSTHY